MSIAPGKATTPALTVRPEPVRAMTRPFCLKRMTSLVLALLIVVAFVAVFGLYTVIGQAPVRNHYVAWSACGMLVCTGIVILLLGKYMLQRSMNHLEQQIRTLQRDDRLDNLDDPVPDELKSVMAAMNDYVAHVRDRFERLRLQKKELDIQMRVADSERRNTEAIIFSIPDAVLVIDSYGELVLANTAAETLFNFRLADWKHRPIERVLSDNALVTLVKEARTVGDRSIRRQVEYSAIRDGKAQTFNITLSTVIDEEGHARGVVAVFHDITREREIAQIKTDFVSSVSHELRTPLSSIKAYIEMLMDNEAHDDRTRQEFYEIIECETDRLQRLISNILNISRIESGVTDIRRESIEPDSVVKKVLEMMRPQAAEKEIALEYMPGESVPSIWADADLLYQSIVNLVSNAIKYTHKGGTVTVQTAVDPEKPSVMISVADNGIGIGSQDLPRMFDKFYRAKDAAQMAKGTGLGLNLVKHIVEAVHQGEIAVASERGVGTTITLRLPSRVS